jgi:hypothetical protein
MSLISPVKAVENASRLKRGASPLTRVLEGACQGWVKGRTQMWDNPMADSTFASVAMLASRITGGPAHTFRRPGGSAPLGMVPSIASPLGGVSDFFLLCARTLDTAPPAWARRLAMPVSNTKAGLPLRAGVESRLLALVQNPGAKFGGFGHELPAPHTGAAVGQGGNRRAAMRVTEVTIRSH